MKFVTWNINSVRARIQMMYRMISTEKPDVILLQEIKCVDADFPYDGFPDYDCHIWGQKSYNGVAILVRKGLQVDSVERIQLGGSEQSRCIQAEINGIKVISVYVPCGSTVGPMYEYKKAFLEDLGQYIGSLSGKIVIGGDFNVALTDADVQSLPDFKDGVLCLEVFRERLRKILSHGLDDMVESGQYTWWDYRSPYKGLRIDYIFTRGVTGSQSVKQAYRRMVISDHVIMKDSKPKLVETKPSDHVPIVLTVSSL